MTKTLNLNTETEDGDVMNGELVDSSPITERVTTMSLDTLDTMTPAPKPTLRRNGTRLPLEAMMDVPVTLVFEVGRSDITIKQLMELRKGSYVELRNVSVDSIDVRVNDKIIAEAETIAFPRHYGIRLGEVAMIQISEDEQLNA